MRWSLPISVLLHALLVLGFFITQRPATAPIGAARGGDVETRSRELVEFEVPAASPQTVFSPPKPPLEVIPPTAPPDTAAKGAYQISISPSFTGANSARPDTAESPAKTERTATEE